MPPGLRGCALPEGFVAKTVEGTLSSFDRILLRKEQFS
jgi:hypothetical protein